MAFVSDPPTHHLRREHVLGRLGVVRLGDAQRRLEVAAVHVHLDRLARAPCCHKLGLGVGEAAGVLEAHRAREADVVDFGRRH